MLTTIVIRNFKLFEEVEIDLAERVVFVGPNNAGKTSALQALTLWDIGVKRWLEKRGGGPVPKKRPGVTISRRDLIAVPVPTANMLWRNKQVRQGRRVGGKTRTQNVLVEIYVEGVSEGKRWVCGMEFDYANEESFYCRPMRTSHEKRMEVPSHLADLRLAYLPPMAGLASREDKLEMGSINARLGEGQTSQVLRNLCWQVLQSKDGEIKWKRIVDHMEKLFGVKLNEPRYVRERGEIVMDYSTHDGVKLDLSASGLGQLQTLLLLAYMSVYPGAVLLIDEPDAHLEILRQRQIYHVLAEQASETDSQIIIASHSEVILNEAAGRDTVIAFVGKPHRIDDRGSQVLKALTHIGFEHYLQAEQKGWVLYLEGSTDLAILRAFANTLEHPSRKYLEDPFVHYVGNQPRSALDHFYGIREAKSDLQGVAIYDRLNREPPEDPNLVQMMWSKREIENYLCQESTLLAWAEAQGKRELGDLGGAHWREMMKETIDEIAEALRKLGKDPWSPDIKASDEFLNPLFESFFRRLDLPNRMPKSNYHTLAPFVPREEIDPEVIEKLDIIASVAEKAEMRSGANV